MDRLLPREGVVMRSGRVEELVDELAAHLSIPGSDPFAAVTVCVGNPGMARWLALRLAHRLGAGSGADGICAAVSTPTLARFTELAVDSASGVDRRTDPWSRRRLTGLVLQAMRASVGEPWFSFVSHHLGDDGDEQRPGRWFDTAARIAGLFRRYWTHRPDLVRSWAAGSSASAADPAEPAVWQAELWRRVLTATEVLDPETRLRHVCDRLRAGDSDGFPERLFVLAPGILTVREVDLLSAVSAVRPVWIGLAGAPSTPSPHPLAAALGRQSSNVWETVSSLAGQAGPAAKTPRASTSDPASGPEPTTVLAALQCDLLAGRPPIPRPALRDTSVQIHLSHGSDRQIEVLREVLTGLFCDDPTLEPRDVAVLTPDPQSVAPLVKAAFCLPTEAEPSHPGHRLRVRVSAGGGAVASPLLALLISVLETVAGRVTLADFIALAGTPAVSRRFGFTPEDVENLAEWLRDAGVRWGLDANHRALFGLSDIEQNTLASGLDRLLLGVALDAQDATVVGGVAPLDTIESTQISVLGRTAELAARLARLAADARVARPAPRWAEVLRVAASGLASTGPEDAWQESALAATLDDLARLGDTRVDWAVGDVLAFLHAELRDLPARSSFGNGSLTVTDLSSLQGVPHRVIAVVGLDESSFPRVARADGDDLVASCPQPLDPDRRRADRQALLDAVLSARERLVLIGQGADPTTNTPVPLTLPLLDLIDALAATAPAPGAWLQIQHPLYPYSPASFRGPVGSFDRASWTAASARPQASVNPWQLANLAPPAPGEISLRSLLAFFRHPLRELLRIRCGLPVYTDTVLAPEIPIELDGLGQWHVGDRLLDQMRAGGDFDTLLAAERASGALPPGILGESVLDKVSDRVRECLRTAAALDDAPVVRRDLSVPVQGWTLTGSVETVADELRFVRFSKLTPGVQLEAWLSLLLLQASDPSTQRRAVTVTATGLASWRIAGIDPTVHLSRLLRIYRLGMSGPIPLPLKTGFSYARDAAAGRPDPLMSAADTWRDESRNDDWWGRYYASFDELTRASHPADLGLPLDRTYFGTLSRTVWAPILSGEERYDERA